MCTELVSMHPVHLDEEGILYFEEQVLETDSWKRSGKCESSQIFRNHNNHVLVAHPSHEDLQAVFEHITDQEILKVPGIKFDIHSYQDSKPKGLSVAFTVEWNHQIYHMYVEKRESKMKVKFKDGLVSISERRHSPIHRRRHQQHDLHQNTVFRWQQAVFQI
ncbi:interleukin-18 isoform X2 [Python bivittatus]|uniref:Interleukin-18 isoform X2 n=1 Tax=Python bivittatus TaxID=176946 RepID=A0A9F5MNE3_PYTBI|nr:interleukin-18 isoform X2 [Python bivittatus]